MPPLPNSIKELEKIAWGWVESTHPDSVKSNHILSSYRLKLNFCKDRSCRKNCRGNPFCLANIGEARIKERIANLNEENLPRRGEGEYVGLKNLGATCYVNSLLQLWFHNKTFRDAILSWNPLDDPKENENSSLHSEEIFTPKSVVGHLQQVFALMYYSECKFIDPSAFIESLRLDTSTQQDAQEFSKLFISLLETSLQCQKLTGLQNLISNNFRGQYAYVTRCCKCLNESVNTSKFYELDLNVRGHSTLTECLSEFLQEERLIGADRYSCPTCQSKEEALRFIKLSSLPPVLNLQLLRFVYDREKSQRKKLKTVIQFPEVLDMKEFVSDASEPIIYSLSAVLIHKGASASSGHYIAYIKDAASGTWNTFNDESVEKLEGKKLQLEDDDSESVKKQKVPRTLKGFQSSTDAYMLVYTSENHKISESEVTLPAKLQEYVQSKNKDFSEYCQQVIQSKNDDIEKLNDIWETYNCLPVDTEELDEIEAISTEWLTSWLNTTEGDPKPIDNSKLICPHGLLEPTMVVNTKFIASMTADQLYTKYGGGPRLIMNEAMCQTCVSNHCRVSRLKNDSLEESKEIQLLLKRRMSVDEPGYYVDKISLKSWRTKLLSTIETDSMSTSKATNNGSSVDCRNENEDVTSEEVSSQKTENIQDGETNEVHNGDASHFIDKNGGTDSISQDEGNIENGGPLEQPKNFNEGVLCLHGNLTTEESDRKLVPVRVWQILKKYFPSAPEFSREAEPCQQCQITAMKDDVVKRQYFEAAVNQKSLFTDLISLKNRPMPGKVEGPVYVVSKQHFHLRWCSFLKSATKRDNGPVSEPPPSLQVDLLLCHHGLLHYSLGYAEDRDRLVLVSRAEWEALLQHYDTNTSVTVNPDLTTNPRLCESCFDERLQAEQKERLRYEKAKIVVRRLLPSSVVSASTGPESEADEGETARKRLRLDDGSKSPIPPELLKVMKEAASSNPAAGDAVRRSTRRKKVPGEKDVTLTVSSSDTLRELKLKITGHLAVAPMDQHLYTAEGHELLGEFQTLADLSILPNAILLLQVDEARDYDEVMQECVTSSEPEAGFKGTGLLHAC